MILPYFQRHTSFSRLVLSLGTVLVGASFFLHLVVLFRIHAQLRLLNQTTLMLQVTTMDQLSGLQHLQVLALPAAPVKAE